MMWNVVPVHKSWAVVDEDGNVVRLFPTEAKAEDWLAYQQMLTEYQHPVDEDGMPFGCGPGE